MSDYMIYYLLLETAGVRDNFGSTVFSLQDLTDDVLGKTSFPFWKGRFFCAILLLQIH